MNNLTIFNLALKKNSVKIPCSKRVRFKNKVFIILIPCIQEYKDLGIQNTIWMSDTDYKNCNHLTSKSEECELASKL